MANRSQVIVFERAGLVFVVNLHMNKSFSDYKAFRKKIIFLGDIVFFN